MEPLCFHYAPPEPSKISVDLFPLYLSCTSVSKAVTPQAMLLWNDIIVFSGASCKRSGQTVRHTHAYRSQTSLNV